MKRRVLSALAVVQILVCNLSIGGAVFAQEIPSNLDLSSTDHTLSVDHHAELQSQTAVIDVGGVQKTVTGTDLLTPAEHVALHQVLSGGQQTLILGANGNAVGGTFQLNQELTQSLHHLIVPDGVTAIHDFGTASNLNLAGNLINSGVFQAISSTASVTTATFNAANIMNNQTGILTSVLPAGGLPSGLTSAVASLNLALNAVENIINYGTITSTGNLTMTAGSSIVNALPQGPIGPGAILAAAGNINMQAASIFNQGIILSSGGNINAVTSQLTNMGVLKSAIGSTTIANSSGTALSIININGIISARDDIIARTLSTITDGGGGVLSRSSIVAFGGLLNASNIHMDSVGGSVLVNADEINGSLHLSADEATIVSHSGTLNVADLQVSDSLLANTGGTIDLSGLFLHDSAKATISGSLTAVASGDIVASRAPSSSTLAAGGGDNDDAVTMAAGVDFALNNAAASLYPFSNPENCSDCMPSLQIFGPSRSGGNIRLANVSLFTYGGNLTLLSADDVITGNLVTAPSGGRSNFAPAVMQSAVIGDSARSISLAAGLGGHGSIATDNIITSTSSPAAFGGDIDLYAADSIVVMGGIDSSSRSGSAGSVSVNARDGSVLVSPFGNSNAGPPSSSPGTGVSDATNSEAFWTVYAGIDASAGAGSSSGFRAGDISVSAPKGDLLISGRIDASAEGQASAGNVELSGNSITVSGAISTAGAATTGGAVVITADRSIRTAGITTSGASPKEAALVGDRFERTLPARSLTEEELPPLILVGEVETWEMFIDPITGMVRERQVSPQVLQLSSTPSSGSGGLVVLTAGISGSGDLATGNITATGTGGGQTGGDVILQAPGKISTGNINTSGSGGAVGGNIFIGTTAPDGTASETLTIGTIDASGLINGQLQIVPISPAGILASDAVTDKLDRLRLAADRLGSAIARLSERPFVDIPFQSIRTLTARQFDLTDSLYAQQIRIATENSQENLESDPSVQSLEQARLNLPAEKSAALLDITRLSQMQGLVRQESKIALRLDKQAAKLIVVEEHMISEEEKPFLDQNLYLQRDLSVSRAGTLRNISGLQSQILDLGEQQIRIQILRLPEEAVTLHENLGQIGEQRELLVLQDRLDAQQLKVQLDYLAFEISLQGNLLQQRQVGQRIAQWQDNLDYLTTLPENDWNNTIKIHVSIDHLSESLNLSRLQVKQIDLELKSAFTPAAERPLLELSKLQLQQHMIDLSASLSSLNESASRSRFAHELPPPSTDPLRPADRLGDMLNQIRTQLLPQAESEFAIRVQALDAAVSRYQEEHFVESALANDSNTVPHYDLGVISYWNLRGFELGPPVKLTFVLGGSTWSLPYDSISYVDVPGSDPNESMATVGRVVEQAKFLPALALATLSFTNRADLQSTATNLEIFSLQNQVQGLQFNETILATKMQSVKAQFERQPARLQADTANISAEQTRVRQDIAQIKQEVQAQAADPEAAANLRHRLDIKENLLEHLTAKLTLLEQESRQLQHKLQQEHASLAVELDRTASQRTSVEQQLNTLKVDSAQMDSDTVSTGVDYLNHALDIKDLYYVLRRSDMIQIKPGLIELAAPPEQDSPLFKSTRAITQVPFQVGSWAGDQYVIKEEDWDAHPHPGICNCPDDRMSNTFYVYSEIGSSVEDVDGNYHPAPLSYVGWLWDVMVEDPQSGTYTFNGQAVNDMSIADGGGYFIVNKHWVEETFYREEVQYNTVYVDRQYSFRDFFNLQWSALPDNLNSLGEPLRDKFITLQQKSAETLNDILTGQRVTIPPLTPINMNQFEAINDNVARVASKIDGFQHMEYYIRNGTFNERLAAMAKMQPVLDAISANGASRNGSSYGTKALAQFDQVANGMSQQIVQQAQGQVQNQSTLIAFAAGGPGAAQSYAITADTMGSPTQLQNSMSNARQQDTGNGLAWDSYLAQERQKLQQYGRDLSDAQDMYAKAILTGDSWLAAQAFNLEDAAKENINGVFDNLGGAIRGLSSNFTQELNRAIDQGHYDAAINNFRNGQNTVDFIVSKGGGLDSLSLGLTDRYRSNQLTSEDTRLIGENMMRIVDNNRDVFINYLKRQKRWLEYEPTDIKTRVEEATWGPRLILGEGLRYILDPVHDLLEPVTGKHSIWREADLREADLNRKLQDQLFDLDNRISALQDPNLSIDDFMHHFGQGETAVGSSKNTLQLFGSNELWRIQSTQGAADTFAKVSLMTFAGGTGAPIWAQAGFVGAEWGAWNALDTFFVGSVHDSSTILKDVGISFANSAIASATEQAFFGYGGKLLNQGLGMFGLTASHGLPGVYQSMPSFAEYLAGYGTSGLLNAGWTLAQGAWDGKSASDVWSSIPHAFTEGLLMHAVFSPISMTGHLAANMFPNNRWSDLRLTATGGVSGRPLNRSAESSFSKPGGEPDMGPRPGEGGGLTLKSNPFFGEFSTPAGPEVGHRFGPQTIAQGQANSPVVTRTLEPAGPLARSQALAAQAREKVLEAVLKETMGDRVAADQLLREAAALRQQAGELILSDIVISNRVQDRNQLLFDQIIDVTQQRMDAQRMDLASQLMAAGASSMDLLRVMFPNINPARLSEFEALYPVDGDRAPGLQPPNWLRDRMAGTIITDSQYQYRLQIIDFYLAHGYLPPTIADSPYRVNNPGTDVLQLANGSFLRLNSTDHVPLFVGENVSADGANTLIQALQNNVLKPSQLIIYNDPNSTQGGGYRIRLSANSEPNEMLNAITINMANPPANLGPLALDYLVHNYEHEVGHAFQYQDSFWHSLPASERAQVLSAYQAWVQTNSYFQLLPKEIQRELLAGGFVSPDRNRPVTFFAYFLTLAENVGEFHSAYRFDKRHPGADLQTVEWLTSGNFQNDRYQVTSGGDNNLRDHFYQQVKTTIFDPRTARAPNPLAQSQLPTSTGQDTQASNPGSESDTMFSFRATQSLPIDKQMYSQYTNAAKGTTGQSFANVRLAVLSSSTSPSEVKSLLRQALNDGVVSAGQLQQLILDYSSSR